jgi:hypothetical protein
VIPGPSVHVRAQRDRASPVTGSSSLPTGTGGLPGQDHVALGLVCLSVGCEHVDDVWLDLAAALETSGRPAHRPPDSAGRHP